MRSEVQNTAMDYNETTHDDGKQYACPFFYIRTNIDPSYSASRPSVISPASPAHSSPLSEARSKGGLQSVEAEPFVSKDTTGRGDNDEPDEQESDDDNVEATFACPHCDKTYNSQKSLTVNDAPHAI
jgi:hypothetical protein